MKNKMTVRAIMTKYLPATNHRGSRIKAYDGHGNSATISYPHEIDQSERHYMAALALCDKMGGTWKSDAHLLVEGAMGRNGDSVFVFNYA